MIYDYFRAGFDFGMVKIWMGEFMVGYVYHPIQLTIHDYRVKFGLYKRKQDIMKQISIQITDETARQMEKLARRWGLPPTRHNTPVIERAIATIYILEIGYDEYQRRMKQMQEEDQED
jgi:hypothetical protein